MELSLDPSELERLDADSMAARYEQTLREQQINDGKEDFSDMVAEHAAKQKVVSPVSTHRCISLLLLILNC